MTVLNAVLLALLVFLNIALWGAKNRADQCELNRITELHMSPVVTPWIDEKYGCEYLVSDKGGITPRIGSECREFLPHTVAEGTDGFPDTVASERSIE